MQKKVITMLFIAVEGCKNSEISLLFGHIAGKRDFGQKKLFLLKVAKMGLKYNGIIENTKKITTDKVQNKVKFGFKNVYVTSEIQMPFKYF